MKTFQTVAWDEVAALAQRDHFRHLLETQDFLSESQHVLPLFQACPQLALALGDIHLPNVGSDRVAFAYDLFGDFACDLAVGNAAQRSYLFVEFEGAEPDSIFRRQGRKATREWAPSFACGFCQLVDWFAKLDDQEKTDDFEKRFGARSIHYAGLLVIGREQHLEAGERRRLEWWRSRLLVDSHVVACVTFDELLARIDALLTRFARKPRRPGKRS